MPMQGLLQDQVVLLTASTSGIGLETAAMMGEAGARTILLNGRGEEAGRAAIDAVKRRAPQAEVQFIQGDVSDEAQAARIVSDAVERHGAPHTLMHCGGAQVHPDLFLRSTLADARRLIDGHLMAVFNICHALLPAMVEKGHGSIIIVASDAAKIATPGESVIGAAKAAAVMFTRCLALEMSRHGIRANALTPSIVRDRDRIRASCRKS